MKDFHSYSIHFLGKGNIAPIHEYFERDKLGRAECQEVLNWLDQQRNQVQAKLNEMMQSEVHGPMIIFARLPTGVKPTGECEHVIFNDLPPDLTVIDTLKDKVRICLQSLK